jgi:hypothetical protein
VYRRFRGDQYDPNRRKVTFLAFRPRAFEGVEISGSPKGYITEEEAVLNPRDPSDRRFGLCQINIEKAYEVTSGGVVVRYAPTSGRYGHAHVVVTGLGTIYRQIRIAELAEIVRLPPGSG